jgi:hypothetical protein
VSLTRGAEGAASDAAAQDRETWVHDQLEEDHATREVGQSIDVRVVLDSQLIDGFSHC